MNVNERSIDALIKDAILKRQYIHHCLIPWGMEHFRAFPWRINTDPYAVLVSEILLRRTTSSAVKRIYEEFLTEYPDIQRIANADGKELERSLARIGFHKKRTRILLEIASFIMTEYEGRVPCSKEQLLSIPHVGNYTANAVLIFAYDVAGSIVDSNIDRIITRVFFKHLSKASSRMVQRTAGVLSSTTQNKEYNYALLDLGALVCTYGIPKCKICPLNSVCDYYLLGNIHR